MAAVSEAARECVEKVGEFEGSSRRGKVFSGRLATAELISGYSNAIYHI